MQRRASDPSLKSFVLGVPPIRSVDDADGSRASWVERRMAEFQTPSHPDTEYGRLYQQYRAALEAIVEYNTSVNIAAEAIWCLRQIIARHVDDGSVAMNLRRATTLAVAAIDVSQANESPALKADRVARIVRDIVDFQAEHNIAPLCGSGAASLQELGAALRAILTGKETERECPSR